MSQKYLTSKSNDSAADQRGGERYAPIEYDLWNLSCDKKEMPPTWIIDLNHDGARIRMGHFKSFNVGDLISIKIQHANNTFIDCFAEVKWKAIYPKAINMFQMGLAFINTKQDHNCPHKTADEITQNYMVKVDAPDYSRPQFNVRFSLEEITSAITIPFLIGLVAALF